MTEQEKNKLRELLLNAVDAYKQLKKAKEDLEEARLRFGYAKLYSDEPRFIEIDGKLWKVFVPFPPTRYDDDDKGSISFEILGDYV